MIFPGSRWPFLEIMCKARRNIGSADNGVNGHRAVWLKAYLSVKFAFTDQRTNFRFSIGFRPLRFGVMLLETAVITAQPLLHPEHRLVGAGIGVRRTALGAQYDLGVEVEGAIGVESGAFSRHRHVPGITAVKIFAHRLADAPADPLAQRLAEVQVFSRDAK